MNQQEYHVSNKQVCSSFAGGVKSYTFFALIILVDCFSSPAVYAQVEGVEKGDRVRISAPTVMSGKFKGTVASLSSTVLTVVHRNKTLFIPYPAIRKMEISTGKKRGTGKGFLIGAGSGALFLGSLTAIQNDPTCDEDEWCFITFSNAFAFRLGAAAGALIGGLTGAVIGSTITRDRWKEVPVNISMRVSPAPQNNLGFEPSVSIRFRFGK